MSRYDGLIIPRSYSEYINKTDAATLSQALALPGVMDATPTESSNKAARSGGIYNAIDAVKPVDTVALNNMQSVTSNAVSRAMSYSTSEVNTGKKWIDGKTIYRKVLVSQNTIFVDTSDYKNSGAPFPDNRDLIISIDARLLIKNWLYYSTGNPTLYVASITPTTISAGEHFIIEYTKITD